MGPQGFHVHIPQLISILNNINQHSQDYYYYMTPCPWLQVKILRILLFFPAPEEPRLLEQINNICQKIIGKVEVSKHVNKNNADHGILFQALKLIIHYREKATETNRKDTVSLLTKFISVKEPNIRCLAFDTIAQLSSFHLSNEKKLISDQIDVFLNGLKDRDVSIRKRALDTLFAVCCDSNMAAEIVNELLDYLQEGDSVSGSVDLKEEIVLKVAILAEKFAENLSWYIDVIIKLIEYAGDYVNEDLWFRVAQMITGFG